MPDFESKLIDFIQIMDAQLTKMRIDIKEIRKDLRYHIKRTDALEEVVIPLQRDLLRFKIMGAVIMGIGMALGGSILWLIQVIGGMKPLLEKLL